ALRSGRSGRHRQPSDRARVGEAAAEERNREVLRRRYNAQTQAPGAAERREKKNEAGRQSGNSPRGVSCGLESVNGESGYVYRQGVESKTTDDDGSPRKRQKQVDFSRICRSDHHGPGLGPVYPNLYRSGV